MDAKTKFDENLNIATLSVQVSQYEEMHHFEVKKRKVHNSFGLILCGSVTLSTLTETITAQEGDLLFIPEGIRYVSHWEGRPHIRFISLHFRMQSPRSTVFRSERIQKIEQVDGELRGIFLSLAEGKRETEAEDLAAISQFYRLCALTYPTLSHQFHSKLPPALQNVLEYIGENYCRITKVSEISKACYLSGSHLYHLFAEYLGISPVAYLNGLRIQEAADRLMTTDKSIGTIAAETGFHSEFYFRKVFRQITGVLPSQYRKNV